ncbi:MAG: PAS domain S-box protein [Verrucomicrobiota bacterium]
MSRPRFLIAVAGLYAMAGGISTLAGWATDRQWITDWANRGISMMPNMAVALTCAGAALLSLLFGKRTLAGGLGLMTGLIGAATLFENITGTGLGIDSLLFPRPWGQRAQIVPGRIGLPGSISLTILGTSVLLTMFGRKSRKAAVVGGMLVITITLLSITGYVFGANTLYSTPRLTTIALQTAIFLLALGIGLVASIPEAHPMKMLRENSSAAALARRALPIIIPLPLLIGWLRMQGQNAGLYDAAFGAALRSVVEIALLIGLLWWAAAAVKAHEKPLRESEERSRTLFDSAPMAILSCDQNGVVQHYNRRAVELWGREPVRGVERNSGSVKLWRPDGTFLPREQSPMVEVLRTGVAAQNVELVIERPDGSRLPILVNFVAQKNDQGEITGAIASFVDISERKEAEKKIRETDARKDAILKSALDAIVTIDQAGNFVEFNPAAENIFGYSGAEVMGKPMADLIIPTRLRGAHHAGLARYLSTGEGPVLNRQIELPALRADGTEFPAELAIVPVPGSEPPMFTAFLRDITERKRAEEGVLHQKRLLEALTESVPDGILIVSPEGRMIQFNQNFLNIWNFPPAVVESKSDQAALAWAAAQTADPAAFIERVGAIYNQPDEFFREEVRMLDGRVYERSGSPILSGETRLGWVWTFRNITKRKRIETNLAFLSSVSQDLIRSSKVDEILQHFGAKVGAHFNLSLFNFVEVNEEAGEVIVTHDWHREDVPSIVGVYRLADYFTEDFQRACRLGEIFVVNDTATDPRTDAHKYAVLKLRAFVCVPLARDGKWKFLINAHHSEPHEWSDEEIELIREVTARFWSRLERVRAEVALRESEERFRAIADNIPQLAWFADAGGVGWFNQAWLDYTGTTLAENYGTGWRAVHHPDHVAAVAEKFERHLREGLDWEDTFPLRGKDGKYRWFLSRMNAIRDQSGKVMRFFGTNTDVTEQRETAAKLAEANEIISSRAKLLENTVAERTLALRETNDQLESFVYSIAHDLRAPLRSMQGFSQILIDDHAVALDETGRNFLARINNSAEFMDKLILDLLAFGRTARAEMEFEAVDVRKAWDNALFQCGTEIELTKAKVESAAEFPSVRAHEATLSQALANLLSNSLKFIPPGVQPRIRFWTEENGGAIRLWIEDNGVGISKEHQERVFRVFERLHGARYPGTGIGLSIVRKGVERMNGKIGLESEPGKGTRFWIELPKA